MVSLSLSQQLNFMTDFSGEAHFARWNSSPSRCRCHNEWPLLLLGPSVRTWVSMQSEGSPVLRPGCSCDVNSWYLVLLVPVSLGASWDGYIDWPSVGKVKGQRFVSPWIQNPFEQGALGSGLCCILQSGVSLILYLPTTGFR